MPEQDTTLDIRVIQTLKDIFEDKIKLLVNDLESKYGLKQNAHDKLQTALENVVKKIDALEASTLSENEILKIIKNEISYIRDTITENVSLKIKNEINDDIESLFVDLQSGEWLELKIKTFINESDEKLPERVKDALQHIDHSDIKHLTTKQWLSIIGGLIIAAFGAGGFYSKMITQDEKQIEIEKRVKRLEDDYITREDFKKHEKGISDTDTLAKDNESQLLDYLKWKRETDEKLKILCRKNKCYQ